MKRKLFWTVFMALGAVADLILPLWWALVATIPIGLLSWWLAYRSDWFEVKILCGAYASLFKQFV
jgi:hypothetical protein